MGVGPGAMEAANRGASEAWGQNAVLGISLPNEAHDNPYVNRELAFDFHCFFMRKFWFIYLAKTIVFLPGGFGILDEFSKL
jgi:predicted Rossmann-fold nucleotide-binding protein